MSSCTSLETFIYPLKGSIQFEVDDIETLGDANRYSKSIEVGKTKWCIFVAMECSDDTDNVTHLGIFLDNLYDFEEGDKVEAKRTLRLLHEDASKVIIKFSNTNTYNDKFKNWGSYKFIEKTKLMNEGTIDLFQSRPNNVDMRAMLPDVDFEQKRKTIEVEFQVDKISYITIYSHVFYVDGIPWYDNTITELNNHYYKLHSKVSISRKEKEVEKLGVFLDCNDDDKSEWWRVEMSTEFRILNRDDSTKILSKSCSPTMFSNSYSDMGNLFDWNEIFNVANGYVKYGRICIEATVYIRNKYGFDEKTGKGFRKPMKKMTDTVITVEGREFHLSRMILSHQSSWFTELFSNDPKISGFAISGVSKKYFTMFLQLVYNKSLILRAEECIKRLDHQLIGMEVKDDMKMLKLIDKYRLSHMKARYVVKYQDMNSMKKLLKDPEVVKLSDELREQLTLDKPPMEKEEDKKPFYEYSKHTKTIEKLTGPKEMFQKNLKENPEAKKLLEDPELQNIGNSVLSFLSQISSENPCLLSYREFSDPSDMVTINFKDNKIFYSSKQILANASEYFMKRYYGPDAKDDDKTLIFDEISSKDFNIFMNHIYHPTISVTESNLDILLLLAHRFVVTDILTKCENYIIQSENMSVHQKEEYAKKYNLEYLLSACKNYIEKK